MSLVVVVVVVMIYHFILYSEIYLISVFCMHVINKLTAVRVYKVSCWYSIKIRLINMDTL